MKSKWKSAAAALALFTSMSLAGCTRKSEAAATGQQPAPVEVRVSTVVEKDVPIYGDWVSTLDGYVNANIQPQVTGYLVTQPYREGSFVHKDEVLFEIDPRPFQAALDQARGQLAQAKGQLAQAEGQLGQARAQLRLAQINVQRDTPLAAAHAIPQSQLDTDTQAQAQGEAVIKTDEAAIQSSQAAIQAAEAAVEQAQLNLGYTKVRALIGGIAGIAQVQVGNLVTPSTVLTAVSQINPIKVYFPISGVEYLRIAGRVGPGTVNLLSSANSIPLELILANGKTYGYRGRILFANRQMDSQTETIQIVGAFPNPANILRPGQTVRVRAVTEFRKGALLVPQRAVAELQGGYQVAVVQPGDKIAIRAVEVGERVGSMWIINQGLKMGERVVAEGTQAVREGMVVRPAPYTEGN
jgi:RND family efflux transporter MFP subunit